MAKRKRRDQQHMRQTSTRRKTYTIGGSAPQEVYRPGFPMNLLGNLKVFSAVGLVIVAIFIVTAIWTNPGGADTEAAPDPTATPTGSVSATPSASVTASATPKTFAAAEDVIDETVNEYTALVKTSKGDFTIKLFADQAPNTVNSFVFLAKQGYFDGLLFHRVLKNFVIQTGDPTGTGTGGPGYTTNDEPNELRNTRGTIAMAKSGTSKFFGSQWFVNLKENKGLDFDGESPNQFYPFGEIASGMDVVDAISQVPVTNPQEGKPVEPVTITSITIEEKPK